MKWVDVTNADLKAAVAAVKYSHDPDAARNLIEYFHERMRDGEQYDLDILHELMAHVFSEIVENKCTADQAFGLKLRRGKYLREPTFDRDVAGAAYMVLLMRNGWTWQDAKGEAANLFFSDDRGDKAMETAYSQYKECLQFLSNQNLAAMLPSDTPVIKRNMAD